MPVARRALVLLVALLALGGCGGGDDAPRADEDVVRSAGFLDPRSDLLAALSLDLGAPDWQAISTLYPKAVRLPYVREELGSTPLPPTFDGALALISSLGGLDFAKDVKPVLGGRLLVGIRTTPGDAARSPAFGATLAYTAPDGNLGRVVRRLVGDGAPPRDMPGVPGAKELAPNVAIVGGKTLVAVAPGPGDDGGAMLRERLIAGSREDVRGPDVPADASALLAAVAKPAALGALLSDAELPRAQTESTAGRALRSASARVDLDAEGLFAFARVDFDGLRAVDLPVGDATQLALPAGVGIGSASADQARTTTFMTRLARELLPRSRFVRRVERLERETGLRFEDEVLRAFAGPSLTVLRPPTDGRPQRFQARSNLRDPARMRALLPRIAPELPGILEGLQGLQSAGLAALLLLAPDAPLTPAASSLLAAVDVRPLSPPGTRAPDPLLFAVSGLDPDDRRPGPDALVYGVVGDAFVVGSTRKLALDAATLQTARGAKAGSQTRVDLPALAREVGGSALLEALATLVGPLSLQASAQGGDVVASARIATK